MWPLHASVLMWNRMDLETTFCKFPSRHYISWRVFKVSVDIYYGESYLRRFWYRMDLSHWKTNDWITAVSKTVPWLWEWPYGVETQHVAREIKERRGMKRWNWRGRRHYIKKYEDQCTVCQTEDATPHTDKDHDCPQHKHWVRNKYAAPHTDKHNDSKKVHYTPHRQTCHNSKPLYSAPKYTKFYIAQLVEREKLVQAQPTYTPHQRINNMANSETYFSRHVIFTMDKVFKKRNYSSLSSNNTFRTWTQTSFATDTFVCV